MTQNELAIIVAYYLARFNTEGLDRLGFSTFNEAFEQVAQILSVKKNYVKLRRDEFDLIFPWRRGWQRPMDRRIIKVVDTFQDLDEQALFRIVSEVLGKDDFRKSEEASELADLISNDKRNRKKGTFIPRAVTGRKAEEFFMNFHAAKNLPQKGMLIDTRDLGSGYDFKIKADRETYYVEVKGLAQFIGGVVFTDKEWQVAKREKENYFLAIVRNIDDNPKIQFIQNPTKILAATQRIYTSVQVQWSVNERELDSTN